MGIRKANPMGLKKLFKISLSFIKDADLISGEVIAIDGTKSYARHGTKAYFNQTKIERHFAYIEERTQD